MGKWSISGVDGATGAEINETTGVITFEKNTGSQRSFIVTYDDEQGNSVSEIIQQEGGCQA